jgi:hypothetical protein
LQQLTISAIPRGATILIHCHGGGCPFGSRTLKATGSQMALARLFKGARLKPGTVVWFAVALANHVAKVAVYTVNRGAPPTQAFRCLPPRSSRPLACAA